MSIDITKLSAEERKALLAQARELEKKEKEQRSADLAALEAIAAEVVPASFSKLKESSEAMAAAKAQIFTDFMEYLKLKIETIGIKSNQQSHTVTFGNHSIKLGYRITDGYKDDAGYGLAMVHKFLATLAKDDNSKKLLATIYRLLQKNSKGDLDSKKVLELRQIADKHYPETDFAKGMEIIQANYSPKLSKWFIEAYYTDGTGIEKSLPLSITSVDLPAEIDLTFLLPQPQETEQ
ncbi:DUF3164 family protein [Chryseobacterium sp. MFBS3-17]|uniref:DUF3164 family protein n=1 Tax=Chryseobacterium sp. MFBS3-17 TaxID=2886689 RepID=UPI001D0E2B9A|nr:DUF3164 family protein [Chryseobacterium sp. MFBS3-17]MCC2590330.1 DUF3164 family protein [Chryseobacterium sp. MFBS3-17]